MAGRMIGTWSQDPLWAKVYPRLVENPILGAPLWRLGLGTDITRLYAAAREIGEQPEGTRVLDVPAGSGVALRGLRPGGGVDVVAADISPRMLERCMATAHERGVADQVTPTLADVGQLPFDDDTFDLVSFTGLHVLPDPRLALGEMVRVLKPGAPLSGSSMFTGDFRGVQRRYEIIHGFGRAIHVLGPMCSEGDLVHWLRESGADDVRLEMSGGVGYFRAVKAR